MIRVLRQGRSLALPLWPQEAEACVRAMLDEAQTPEAGLELLLADDATLAALNREHLGLPGPTNVLAFPDAGPEDEPERGPDSLGFVAVSLDAVRREALLYGQDPPEHFCRLVAHGLLHLLGHDHGPDMEAETERLLAAGLACLVFPA